MRIVLDTNVVASGLLWDGPPAALIDAARAGKIELFTSRALLAELTRILRRAKFARPITVSGASLEELVLGYSEIATEIVPASISAAVPADPDDAMVLASALAARADMIVSGDSDLLNLKSYQGMPIIAATEALARVTKAGAGG
jgi:hypothetical protein